MTGPKGGRPKKRDRLPRSFPVVLYDEDKALYDTGTRYAHAEGKSLSDVFKEALADYLRLHAPSNPQLNIYANSDDLSMTDRISLNFMRRQAREKVDFIGSIPAKIRPMRRVEFQQFLLKASKVYDRTRDGELKSLIEKLEGLLGNGK